MISQILTLKTFIDIQEEYTVKPSNFLVIEILHWLHFRKNLLERI